MKIFRNFAGKMKHTIHTIFLLSAACAVSCGTSADNSGPAMKAAAEAGRRDASEVMAHPSGSMDREKGVFAIRARETELRESGLDSCANAYARGAYAVIDSTLNAEKGLR